MSLVEIITHAFASAFMIFWGCNANTSGSNLITEIGMYLVWKVAPIIVGLSFAFDIYAQFMGWPV